MVQSYAYGVKIFKQKFTQLLRFHGEARMHTYDLKLKGQGKHKKYTL